MSDNQKDKPTLSMKVLKGPKQIEREKSETIWDRFERLQRSLAPLRKGKQIKRGVYRIRRTSIERSCGKRPRLSGIGLKGCNEVLLTYAKENKSKGEFILSRKRMKQNLCLLKRRPLQVQNLQRS